MTSSLVGSEMCIRDRCGRVVVWYCGSGSRSCRGCGRGRGSVVVWKCGSCLLYTSDAADDM
eukprot:269078-Prorocentrum_lima.AAC.1